MRRKQHSTSGLLAAFLFVAAMMLPASVWAQSVTTEQPAKGNGTLDNPYQIANAAQLAWFRDWVNVTYTPAEGETATLHKTAYAKRTADIDMSSVCSEAIGSWVPIASYKGIFDGDGHTLSNLYVNTTDTKAGMFGSTSDCTIKNITFSGVNITGGGVTGIIGSIDKCSVTNVTVTDGVITGKSYVGGICGSGSESTISHCTNHAQVTSIGGAGGISGDFSPASSGSISHCANYGNVEGNREVGGILGCFYRTAYSLANVM